MKVKRKYAAIDIAKYVSALLVVCIHTYPFYEISETFNTFFMQTICRIAVPFFFTTSGFSSSVNMEMILKKIQRIFANI